MAKYRKKPIVVEAERWFKHGDHAEVVPYDLRGYPCGYCGADDATSHGQLQTLEGEHCVCPGDWIITGVKGERYACKPDIFDQTYELVEETT